MLIIKAYRSFSHEKLTRHNLPKLKISILQLNNDYFVSIVDVPIIRVFDHCFLYYSSFIVPRLGKLKIINCRIKWAPTEALCLTSQSC